MTGSEAWVLISPVLARFIDAEPDDQDTFAQVYVTAFLALKEYDQKRGRKFLGELQVKK